MIKQVFLDNQGNEIPNPISFDWREMINDGSIDLSELIAVLLLVVAKANDEGRNAVNGIMFHLACFLQLDGSFWFHSDDYKEINSANVEFAEFLMRASQCRNVDKPRTR